MSYLDDNKKLRKLTANEWQLYTCSMPCGLAAHNLTNAVRRELEREIPRRLAAGMGLKDAITASVKHLFYNKDSVFDRYAKYGACDTEPRCVLFDILGEYAYKVHGVVGIMEDF